MNKQRRNFLSQVSLIAGIATLNKPLESVAAVSKRINTIYSEDRAVTIYNTNDLHGKMGSAFSSQDGMAGITKLLANQETAGLLVDAGDFLNAGDDMVQHRKMIQAMNAAGYGAATPGNAELSLSREDLTALIPMMKFTLVNCNYRLSGELASLIKPYVIVHTGKFKVGITGVGQPIEGIGYNDAIECANNMAKLLKTREQCDMVICLSHLGYSNDGDMADNKKLAHQSEHIDFIAGGHNRKVLSGPMVLLNKKKHEVILSQACWDGLMLGKTVIGFDAGKQKNSLKAKHMLSDQPEKPWLALSHLRAKEKKGSSRAA